MAHLDLPLRIQIKPNSDSPAGVVRRSGIVRQEAIWRPGARALNQGAWVLDADADSSTIRSAYTLGQSLDGLLRRFSGHSAIAEMQTKLDGCDLSVRFIEGGAFLLALETSTGAIEMAVDVVDAAVCLDSGSRHDERPEDAARPGFELLLALGLVYILLCRGGRDRRSALHALLDLHRMVTPAERSGLFRALDSPALDPDGVFALFLKKAGSSDVPAERDRCITWLLGQDRIDLPYDRAAAQAILSSASTADDKRRRLYDVARNYDQAVERGNIERISSELREAGEVLIFGRMSRAFHDQGLLFADAALIRPSPHWSGLADKLTALAKGDGEVESAAWALRLLLKSSDELPLAQLEGALERFEDSVLDAQKRLLAEALKPARERVENHSDRLSSGSSGLPDATPIFRLTERRLSLAERLRHGFLEIDRRPAAYVVVSQRPSPTGSHLLVKLNEFDDPYPGKPENLRKLFRLAGDRIYASPDYGWLEVADHWIEAIPLFIKEEVHSSEGRESSRTVVDIAGMEESFREEMADLWASNLRRVLESEFLALARERVAEADGKIDEEALRRRLLERNCDPQEIAALGVLFNEAYRRHVLEVQRVVEVEDLAPYEAARRVLSASGIVEKALERRKSGDSWRLAIVDTLSQFGWRGDFGEELARLVPDALKPRRRLPALHVLTTQSAGMTDGYVRTWLEESMALSNIVDDLGLRDAVETRRQFHAARLAALSEKLVRELGAWAEVEDLCASDSIGEEEAIRRVVSRSQTLKEEVSCLGTLLEARDASGEQSPAECVDDPEWVLAILESEAEGLGENALDRVLERNGGPLRAEVDAFRRSHPEVDEREALRSVVAKDESYRLDHEVCCRLLARRMALERLHAEHPERGLPEQCETFFRRRRNLAKTLARKEIIAERGLNRLTLHPLYYFRATGGGKRYHLLYTPSRVDLGQRERESVESWPQWVGGADRAATREGRRLYRLINKKVQTFDSLCEPEVLKTGENASMVSHYAFSNALSLTVAAERRGDFENMADQMNRRHDRRVHPAGEGYGGYCVPKDGLFLEFVLSLRRTEKLRQIGLPDYCHESAVRLAHELLDRRRQFSSPLDWESWAAQRMREADLLPAHSKPATAVFQSTRIAQVLDGLGSPELLDSGRIGASLAARWSLHKMVTGGEQVNRFMPFFKVWLIRRALAESARRHPDAGVAWERAVVVLTAEYKPDTQDARFSAGMRKFEILAGVGDHLLSALDAEGQDLALLLVRGYPDLERLGRSGRIFEWLGVHPSDREAEVKLRRFFPACPPPGEIRLVSPTGLSTQDLMAYTSDTQLPTIAGQTRGELQALGFGAGEIEANLRTHGPRLTLWDHRLSLAPEAAEELSVRLGGRIHALALATLGPTFDYPFALQGADVLDTGIPHRALLDLIADPGYLCGLMLDGNPRSALAIVDGASGARPRAMNRLDVMLWFAAGDRRGREAIYLCVGIGEDTVETWRAAMRRQRRQAERLWLALADGEAGEARQVYREIVGELRDDDVACAELDEIERLARSGRLRERDRAYAEALAGIAAGLPLESIDFAGFLALGGMFLLAGADSEEIDARRASFESGVSRLGNVRVVSSQRWMQFFPPPRSIAAPEFREERGVESSNKAMEERASVALETRRQLAGRLARARGLNERYAGFREVPADRADFAGHYRAAMAELGTGDEQVGETAFGRFMGHARNAFFALVGELADEAHGPAFLARIEGLLGGRRVDEMSWQAIAGGYEDIGDFGKLAQSASERAQQGDIDAEERDRRLDLIAQGAELFEILLAVDSVQECIGESYDDCRRLWRTLAEFFARTINDHHYEYRPWLLSRGAGFAVIGGDRLYAWAVARHAWLYRYLRGVVLRHTELKELPPEERDCLLGNFLDGHAREAIGAEADSPAERAWRAYGQIRELAFIRNDGFPLPEVFPEFDPELIDDRSRINHVIAAPVGRTHFSRMLREGPTLARELRREGRPGANLIIGRKIDLDDRAGLARPMVRLRSGHFHLDAETYRAALACHKPGAAMAEVHPKGVRVAARFTRPIEAALVYPFHGDPTYTTGALEAAGLPYTVQSRFHTWTTYDKAKYPDIFRDSGVELPAEIDWLACWTGQADAATVKDRIRDGLAGSNYPGLAAFASRHAQVIVKDAAESGGRNMRVFRLQDAAGRVDEASLAEAVNFIHQVSLQHNVAVQEAVLGSPEYWATEAFMEDFVRRQIVEWGHPVERRREPRTPIYGSLRVMLSTDDPNEPDLAKKWHASHWIALNSRQLITNVGRGGVLEQLLPEFVRPEFRGVLFDRLAEAARRAAEALAKYEFRAGERYRQETGSPVGEDLMGVSYGKPRYLMLDFVIAPIFEQPGRPVEIRPVYGDDGRRLGSEFILKQGNRTISGRIVDWRVVMIEPNIGVGLWDRVALREEVHELQVAQAEGREPDWDRVGRNARVVLRDLNRAGEDYLTRLGRQHGGLS